MNERIKELAEQAGIVFWEISGDVDWRQANRENLEKFAELIERDVKSKMCGSSKYDERRVLTKSKLMRALKDIPDDVSILVNVEFADGDNWDTYHAFIVNNSFMCPGYSGCTHTEPKMDYDVVLGVKFGHELGVMENLEDDDYERTNSGT